jgi:hypothetical protein
MNTFIIVGIIIISVFELTNTILLSRLKRQAKRSISSLNDERYFELKSKIQFVIVTGSIFLLLMGFLGFDSITSSKNAIATELKEVRSDLANTDSLLLIKKKEISDLGDSLRIIISDYKTMMTTVSSYNNKISEFEQSVSKVQDALHKNPRFYIVNATATTDDLEKRWRTVPPGDPVTLYFNGLNTTQGKKLPIFTKPPDVFILNSDIDLAIDSITKESISVYFNGGLTNSNKESSFSFWIAVQE